MVPLTLCRRFRVSLSASRLFLACLLIALLGLFSTAAAQLQDQLSQPRQQSRRLQSVRGIHIKRNRPAGAVQPNAEPQCNSPDVSYFGGPVISNAQIVVVYWNSNVNAAAQAGLPGFFKGITDSIYYDSLSEYSTNVESTPDMGQTNQSIGRGSYVGAYTIVPSICPATTKTTCDLTDSQLQTELANQIANDVLPGPVYDTNGYVNTLYMVYFPPNISLSFVESGFTFNSCVDFCAYHNTGGTMSNPLVYSAIMDTFTGGCSTGCVNPPLSGFQGLTYDSSHEMAEAVSDADIGFDTSENYVYPVAWAENTNYCGEIADICDDSTGTSVTTSQGSYQINELWSNKLNQCVSAGCHPGFQLNQPSTANAGTPFNFTLTALNPSGGLGTDISYVGTVHFTSSDTASGVVLPSNFTFTPSDQGTANFSATLQSTGAQTITATDTLNNAITATTASITVRALTTTALVSSLNPSTFGQSVTFTATVKSSGSGTPGGEVNFKNGTINLGTVKLVSGSAALSTSSLNAGLRTITAHYKGSTKYAASSSTLTQTVNKAGTTTTITNASPSPSTYGQPVTFTATVNTTAGSASGNVEFKRGTLLLGSGILSGGTASYTTTAIQIPGGKDAITAVYKGDANHAASTSAVYTQTVDKAATTTSLATSGSPSTQGNPVTFTATVSSSVGTPAGNVVFKDGTTLLGTVVLSGGTAQFITSTLAAGTHTIHANYQGNGNYAVSSGKVKQVVQ